MTIKSERTNIKHPMWRKKIDNSILNRGTTAVPRWVCKMWNFDQAFKGVRGRKCADGKVRVSFKGQTFEGDITFTQPPSWKNKKYRLSFEDALLSRLRDTFLMSCMREIEGHGGYTRTVEGSDGYGTVEGQKLCQRRPQLPSVVRKME
jgi:hypothetical protein